MISSTLDISIPTDPILERKFFEEFPKGADLHHHLSGAVYAESLLQWAAEDGLWIDPTTYVATKDFAEGFILASDVISSPSLKEEVIKAWSMESFVPSPEENGHDHFFETFLKFRNVLRSPERKADALTEVLTRALDQNVLRLETKLNLAGDNINTLANLLDQEPGDILANKEFEKAFTLLMNNGLEEAVDHAIAETNTIVSLIRENMGTAYDNIKVGLIGETNRTSPPSQVFSKLAFNFALSSEDETWVAIDLVAPEDNPVALRDYSLHMEMVKFLSDKFSDVSITLHAGELTSEFVVPEDLTFHIREAVEIAGADRIGHGVAIRSEDDSNGLLEIMKEGGVLVEIALTSNNQILGIDQFSSQLNSYRSAGVAFAIATDDEGVSRTNITSQYQLANDWFNLGYSDLKELSYNSAKYAFDTPMEEQQLLQKLDESFLDFEARWSTPELLFGTMGDDSLTVGPQQKVLAFSGGGEDIVDTNQSRYNRVYAGGDGDELLAGIGDRLNGGDGEDTLDASSGGGKNRLYGGKGNDILLAGINDRLFGGEGDDELDASVGKGGNRLYGDEGNDMFFLGKDDVLFGGLGNDQFFVISDGGNTITGNEGADQFWIVDGDLPDLANTITDFELGVDVIGIGVLGLSFKDLSIAQNGAQAIVSIASQEIAIFSGVESSNLSQANFVFV